MNLKPDLPHRRSLGRRSFGIRGLLILLVMGSVLPVAFMAAELIFRIYQRGEIELSQSAANRARAITSALDREFATIQSALQALATSNSVAARDWRTFHAQAVNALKNLHAENIVVLDSTGQLVFTTRLPFGAPLPKLAHPPLLKSTLQTGKPGISDLFVNPMSGESIFTIAVPIMDGETVGFSLNATVSPASLSALLDEQKLPQSWRGAIIDSAGNIAARTHEMAKYLGKKASPDFIQRMNQQTEDSFRTVSLDGLHVLNGYSKSLSTKWTVAVAMPMEEVRADLVDTIVALIAGTLVALSLALAIAWFIAYKLSRSMAALVAPAIAIGNGEVPERPRTFFNEADQVGQTMVATAQRLFDARAMLRETEQQLSMAADAAHLGMWSWNLENGAVWASEPCFALFGFSAAQAFDLDAMFLRIHDDDRAAVNMAIQTTIEHKVSYDVEFRINLADGTQRWIGSRGHTESGIDGRAILLRGVSLDITARKTAEQALQQKQREVAHLARVSMLGELSGALAHELNQPLTAILSNAQAAQRFLARHKLDIGPGADLDEVQEILQDIVDEDTRAVEVIQRLRILLRSGEVERVPVDLNQHIIEVGKILRGDLSNQSIVFSTDCAATLPLVMADPVQIQQVLINLVMNACDAMSQCAPADRHLLVRSHLSGDGEVQVSVCDTGKGIAGDQLAQVFDAFFTTKVQGLGLGLSICRNIVQANSGRIWVESDTASGSRFHFALPACSEIH